MGDEKDVELMTVKELKVALKSRKMPVKGSKDELVERLKMALEGETEDSEDALSESGSEGKTPRSDSPSAKLAEKGTLALDAEEHDFRPVSEREVEEPAPIQPPKTEVTATKPVASEKARVPSPATGNVVVPEWRNLHIPDDWLPMPLIRISNLSSDAELEALRSLLEKSAGLKIAHLTFDTNKPGGRSNAALMRLRAPKEELFAEGQSVEGGKLDDCDVKAIAETTVKTLRALDLTMGQRKLEFEAPLCRTTLFVHNLEEYYGNKDDRFQAEMAKVGDVIRCFIVRNKVGESKDYGFVEYLLPSDAMTAKDILDKKSADALSEFKKQRNSSTGGAAMVPLKRLRCEWACNPSISSLYSKICYISNLPPNFEDREVLRNVFVPYGNVLSCNIRTRPGMGPGCGFVEFERGEDAEKALRALDGSRDTPLGFILVSFVNPGKFPGDVQPTTAVGPFHRNVYPKRPRDTLGGTGSQPGRYGHHNAHPFFPPGRPPFEMQHRARFQRPARGRGFRGGYPPYGNYNQGMYGHYYSSYGQGFMPQGYMGNGAFSQFAPQAPSAYPPVTYGGAGGYSGYRGAPSVPGAKTVGYGEPEYPPLDTYGGGMPYSGAANYTAAGGSHPPSAGGSYGQGLNQSGYPSSYGTGYQQSGYGQGAAAYGQQAGGNFGQQGSYGQVGYGGGNVHGGQIPGTKREHDYEASSYGASHYGKKPRF